MLFIKRLFQVFLISQVGSTSAVMVTIFQMADAHASDALTHESVVESNPLLSPLPVPSDDPVEAIEAIEAVEIIEDSVSIGVDALSTEYRLGPGDLLDIQVFAAEEYSGEVIVTQDGSINLPQVGKVEVEGLTIQQATEVVATEYAVFIRQPVINIKPTRFRPVRIGIAGEVNRPGSYVVSGVSDINESNVQDSRFPSLTQVIAEAGGITGSADLRSVELRRNIGRGQKQVVTIDLWELIQDGSLGQDVILQSGDEVLVPTATLLTAEELATLSDISFAPETIQIYVTGEVEEPGIVEVPLNTPLNQALLAAGGFNPRANRVNVELLRINSNGTVDQRPIAVDFATDIGNPSNPILNDEDVIVVNRSGVARFGDATDIFLNPITGILNAIFGLDRIFD